MSRELMERNPRGTPHWHQVGIKQLGFFITHILIFMQEYGQDIPTEGSKVRVITLAVEEAAAA